jgi:hypothetical protein
MSASKARSPLLEPLERIGTHWLVFLLIVVLPTLAIWGQVLSGYGLPLLFRDDETLFNEWGSCWQNSHSVSDCARVYLKDFVNSTAFYTHGAATFFTGLFWLFAAIVEPRTDRFFLQHSFWQEARYILVRTLPISAVNLIGAIYVLHLYEFSLPQNLAESLAKSQLLRIIAGDIVALPLIALFAESSRQRASAVTPVLHRGSARRITGRKTRTPEMMPKNGVGNPADQKSRRTLMSSRRPEGFTDAMGICDPSGAMEAKGEQSPIFTSASARVWTPTIEVAISARAVQPRT